MRRSVKVFTDGARSKDGSGGWAWWVSETKWRYGGEPDTTNQRMEMMAVIDALKCACLDYWNVDIEIVSDSAYVVNCFIDKWYVKWFETDWKAGQVKNRDLWEEMFLFHDKLIDQGVDVMWTHVRGHQGVYGNEKADKLAVSAKLGRVTQPPVWNGGVYIPDWTDEAQTRPIDVD